MERIHTIYFVVYDSVVVYFVVSCIILTLLISKIDITILFHFIYLDSSTPNAISSMLPSES